MTSEQNGGVSAMLRDSAIIVTGVTVLLFVWGYAFEAFGWAGASVPGLFQPEVAVQERALLGGMLALFVFLPIGLILWVLDIAVGHRMRKWFVSRWRAGVAHQAVLILVLFAVSLGLVRPIANISDRYGRRLRVESVTLKSAAPTTVQQGMYCIGKRGSTYVFVDTLQGPSRRIHLLAEDEITSLVLVYSR